jgi:hypothetical protein
MATYLQVDYKTGDLYEYSKLEKEGFVTNTNSAGTISFRRVLNRGLYGTYEGVSIRDSNFGKELSIALKIKGGSKAYINLPLFDQKKNIASYAESLIRVLGSLSVGLNYRVYPYSILEEGKKYSKVGISVKAADLEEETVVDDKLPLLTYAFTKEGVFTPGDIPAVEWTEDYTGARVGNSTAKNKYLYETLGKYIGPVTPPPTVTPVAVKELAPPIDNSEVDDLPF